MLKAERRATETGPMAKFYSLTRSGRKQLDNGLANWVRLSNAINGWFRRRSVRILDKARLRLRSVFRRSTIDSELEAEVRFHVDQLIQENISSGMPPDEARRAAQRSIGGTTQYQEQCREMRRVSFVEDFVRDIRYAARSIVKSPGFAGVVVVTLALGIGANTAIFTIVQGVLLRPLEYSKPDQLMYLSAESPATGGAQNALSAPEYMDFRQMNRSFAAVGAYSTGGTAYRTGEVNVSAADRPLRVRSISVDAHLLEALGIQPEHGRLFSKEETARWIGTLPPPIAILSHELWQRAFGGRQVVGEKVQIEGRLHEIVGIMPPRADIMDNHTEVWLPLWLHPNTARQRGAHVLYVVGRLKDGVSAQAAQSELTALLRNWGERVGAVDHVPTSEAARSADHILRLRTLQEAVVGSASRPIIVLQAAVGLILLIICANLA
ncbi:MAG TPA: ABC transporter permease, partial [Bryobacteraceae bacterium]|nr:ABC transporter permease [Bryobacteraceae bacterium]